jgi:hypothetical protein
MDNLMALLKDKNIPIRKFIDYSKENETFKVCFVNDPENNVIEFMEGYRDQ